MGHSLKLSHTFTDQGAIGEEPPLRYYTPSNSIYQMPQSEVISVMNYHYTDDGSIYSWQTNTPSFLDKVNLILKWDYLD